ncbi:MAG: enoyl-CoA hydratase/isomerase family protein [Nevskia sp.]|nr:enoyl-CoA hydratase/isomerase family protein [Nevskia sp.]
MPQYIKVDQNSTVCTITLNRDDKRNAFGDAMSEECSAALDQAVAAGCSAVVIRSNPGTNVWSSGHDLTEIRHPQDLAQDSMFVLFRRIVDCPLPVICAVDGDAYAGGFMIALLSDLVVATRRSRFCMTINKMGLPLPIYCYQYCAAVLGLHKAKEMFFTARLIAAEDACTQGLVNHVVEGRDELDARVGELVQAVAGCNPAGVAFSKGMLNGVIQGMAFAPQTMRQYEEGAQHLATNPEVTRRIEALIGRIGGR